MRRSKYGAVKTVVDDITFASRAEARRYSELKLLVRANEISELRLQPRYPFVVLGSKICTYVGDFEYRDSNGCTVCEDVKGVRTPEYIIKRKLFLAIYKEIKHVEVTKK